MFLDNTYSPINYVDYGIAGFNYYLPVYHTDNYLTLLPLTSFKVADADVTNLDITPSVPRAVSSSWFDITTINSKVGDKTSFNWRTNCDTSC
jgi:hypothetical protein